MITDIVLAEEVLEGWAMMGTGGDRMIKGEMVHVVPLEAGIGWSKVGGVWKAPIIPAETIKRDQTASKVQRLDELDRLSIRPLRAILAGGTNEMDVAMLATLEEEAAGLRNELKSL